MPYITLEVRLQPVVLPSAIDYCSRRLSTVEYFFLLTCNLFDMVEEKHRGIDWLDLLWLLFLLGLALVPPLREPHKQFTLLAIGFVQLLESRVIARSPNMAVMLSF